MTAIFAQYSKNDTDGNGNSCKIVVVRHDENKTQAPVLQNYKQGIASVLGTVCRQTEEKSRYTGTYNCCQKKCTHTYSLEVEECIRLCALRQHESRRLLNHGVHLRSQDYLLWRLNPHLNSHGLLHDDRDRRHHGLLHHGLLLTYHDLWLWLHDDRHGWLHDHRSPCYEHFCHPHWKSVHGKTRKSTQMQQMKTR